MKWLLIIATSWGLQEMPVLNQEVCEHVRDGMIAKGEYSKHEIVCIRPRK